MRLDCKSSVMKKTVIILLAVFLAKSTLSAVTVYGGDINKTNPGSSITNWTTGWGSSGITGWDYVGYGVGGGSGVYLGNGWVLTANHVAPSDFRFASDPLTTYTYTGRSDQIGTTDLRVFQINNAPTLPLLALSSNPLAWNLFTPTSVVMIGVGGGAMRWGTNVVELQRTFNPPLGYDYFNTLYNSTNPNEAQGVSGDSGGAVFRYSNGSWSLGGIMNAVASTNGTTNDLTIATQISSYDELIRPYQIMSIPEPSDLFIITTALLLLLFIRKKKSASVF